MDTFAEKVDLLKRPSSHRTVLVSVGAGLAVLIICLFSALHPLPPHTITMATGPAGSSYAVFGQRYKQLLAQAGVQVRLIPTAGGVENLAHLRNSKSGVQLGFVEGGIATVADADTLASLGTVSYEPMWFFTRGISTDRGLIALRGKRVSIGPEGSDSRALVLELLRHNALDIGAFKLLGLSPKVAANELLQGHLDGAVLMTSWDSPIVRRLIAAPGIDLANFSRADAYVALFPSLNKVVVPAGVGDLDDDRPPQDTMLLATKTSLIVRQDLHPALQYLLTPNPQMIL